MDSPRHSTAAVVAFVTSLSAISTFESLSWMPTERLFCSSPVTRKPSKRPRWMSFGLHSDSGRPDYGLPRLFADEGNAVFQNDLFVVLTRRDDHRVARSGVVDGVADVAVDAPSPGFAYGTKAEFLAFGRDSPMGFEREDG